MTGVRSTSTPSAAPTSEKTSSVIRSSTPKVEGRKVLLFDDLFRSGATMNAITSALYDQGQAREVYALTLTRTRSKQ